MESLDEMRIRASSLPYGAERVALRREIWRMRKEEICEEMARLAEERRLAIEERNRRHDETVRRRRERRRESRVAGMVIRTRTRTARKDHECYGCMGECPIASGDDYLEVKLTTKEGLATVRYCQRCHAAITNKVSIRGSLEVNGPGQFRWRRLSSSFRERWNRLISEIMELKKNGKPQSEAIKRFMAENQQGKGMGLHGKSGRGRSASSSSGSGRE